MSLIVLACAQEIIGGIANTGYWGMSVEGGKEYFFSAFAALPGISGNAANPKTGVSTLTMQSLSMGLCGSPPKIMQHACPTMVLGMKSTSCLLHHYSTLSSNEQSCMGSL